jgi:SAM-dependent methyltransferase
VHALDLLPRSAESLLDVGCNDGATLIDAGRLGIQTLRGVDINPEAAAKANERLKEMPDATALHASADVLPFPDATFQVVSCLEVLEHVPAELRRAAVDEIGRVLQPDGSLILSVPFRGLSAILDPENMRFRFPWLYEKLARFVGGRGKEAGYVGQKHGVVFHHHFTKSELLDLLGPGFRITRLRGRGFVLYPAGAWMRWPFYRRGARSNLICRFAEWMMGAEMAIPIPEMLAFNVLLLAQKT